VRWAPGCVGRPLQAALRRRLSRPIVRRGSSHRSLGPLRLAWAQSSRDRRWPSATWSVRCSGPSWHRSSRPRGWRVSWCCRDRKLFQLGRAMIHGGHARDPRRAFSRAEKALLLERAGHRCEHHSWLLGRCRETEALQADHVHPHSRGGATDVADGQALCRWHNRKKAARVPWGRELARLERRRRAYFPPGSVAAVVRHGPHVRSTGERQPAGAVSGASVLQHVPDGAD
jgi:5-methylcytosine-specific restriction endonuclease McrA